MKNYVVLYRRNDIQSPLDEPFGFQCWAESTDHAEEQCLNADPDADIVWVWQGKEGVGMQPALDEYYGISDDPVSTNPLKDIPDWKYEEEKERWHES